MDSILNKNQNNIDNKSLNSQIGLNENNNNDDKNINPDIKIINLVKKRDNSVFSSRLWSSQHFIMKKRKNPAEENNEEQENILKKIELPEIPANSNIFIKHEITKKKKKKIKLEEDIQKMERELDSLNVEIENFKKIKNFLESFNDLLNNINNNEEDGEDKMNITYNYSNSDNNKEDSLSLNQNSNPFKSLDKKNITLQKENQNIDNKYLTENDNYQKFGDKPFILKDNSPFIFLDENINSLKENKNYKKSNNIYEGIEPYSFRCLSNNLNYKIKKGTKESKLEIILENNGKLTWPENETFLLIDEIESDCEIQEINLGSLEPGEKFFLIIELNNLDKFDQGLYKICLLFIVKGKNYGNNILINLEIY